MGCDSCGTGKPNGCKSNGGCSTGGCNRMNTYDWLVNLPISNADDACRVIEVSFNQGSRKDFYRNGSLQYFEKGRIQRWQNMEGKFELKNANAIKGKHVLLVDDVITTGATLEACGQQILKAENVQLSIAALCFSFH